jgi:hypothetical protein
VQSVAAEDLNTSLNKLTVPELKNRLRERGLQISGLKAELISRLKSSTTKVPCTAWSSKSSSAPCTAIPCP